MCFDDDGFICCFLCTPLPVSVSHFLQSAVFVVGSWDPAERFSSLSLDFWNNLIARVHRLGLFVGTTTELGIGFHPRLCVHYYI